MISAGFQIVRQTRPKIVAVLAVVLITVLLANPAWAAFDKTKHDLENILYMELKTGLVVIQMFPEVAPNTITRVKELVRQGFYNGLNFHRVIPDFMAQTGDPAGDGSGGSGQKLLPEFSELHHLRGTLSMARAMEEDSADSQFFIMLQPKFSLDGQYTIWGRVIDGMDNIDGIKKGSAGYRDGEVIDPDKIVSMDVAADVEGPPVPEAPRVNQYPTSPAQNYPGYTTDAPPVENRTPEYPEYFENTQTSARYPAEPARQIEVPRAPLPSWPVEPPHYDTVFPPIPEGGYVPY